MEKLKAKIVDKLNNKFTTIKFNTKGMLISTPILVLAQLLPPISPIRAVITTVALGYIWFSSEVVDNDKSGECKIYENSSFCMLDDNRSCCHYAIANKITKKINCPNWRF